MSLTMSLPICIIIGFAKYAVNKNITFSPKAFPKNHKKKHMNIGSETVFVVSKS